MTSRKDSVILNTYIYILKYLLIYNHYIKYISNISIDKDNKELVFLYNCLKDLHETYKKDIVFEEYCLYVLSKVNDKDREVIESLLEGLQGSTIDDQVIGDVLTSLRNKKLAYDLALISLDVNEGRSSIDKIFDTINQFEQKKETEAFTFINLNLKELHDHTVKQQGLRWRLTTLNRMLGSLRRGDFGFIFARPETGKTTFLASEVTYFATQVEGPILWFNC